MEVKQLSRNLYEKMIQEELEYNYAQATVQRLIDAYVPVPYMQQYLLSMQRFLDEDDYQSAYKLIIRLMNRAGCGRSTEMVELCQKKQMRKIFVERFVSDLCEAIQSVDEIFDEDCDLFLFEECDEDWE